MNRFLDMLGRKNLVRSEVVVLFGLIFNVRFMDRVFWRVVRKN